MSAHSVDTLDSSGVGGVDPITALMVITDGRWDYLVDTLVSARNQLDYPFRYRVLVNDSGTVCPVSLPGWIVVNNPIRQGLAGAIQAGWDALPADVEFVFHLEDDFVFPSTVNVRDMIDRLRMFPTLAQVALMRQPWSPEEHAAGGIYELYADAWEPFDGLVWHRRLFTFNPCVYPRLICHYKAGLEQGLTDRLLEDGWRFAYLGSVTDPPACWHIGVRRSIGHRW